LGLFLGELDNVTSLAEFDDDGPVFKFLPHEGKVDSWVCEITEALLTLRRPDIAKPVFTLAIIVNGAEDGVCDIKQ